tara:strand:- start:322 stop:534 length:213 start_codon:yes stop_codon:yes gene_type:complete
MAKIIKKRFPKKELNAWLREHRSWDHSKWIDLLDIICQIKVSMNGVLLAPGKRKLGFIWKLKDTETTCRT